MDASPFQVSVLIGSYCTESHSSLSPPLSLMAPSFLVLGHEIHRLFPVVDVFYLEETTGPCLLIRIYLPSSNTISHLPFTVAALESHWTSYYSFFHSAGHVKPRHHHRVQLQDFIVIASLHTFALCLNDKAWLAVLTCGVSMFKMQPVVSFFLYTAAEVLHKGTLRVFADAANRGNRYNNLCFNI